MFWRKYKLKPSRHCGQIRSRLLGCVRTVIIKDQTDLVSLGVLLIQHFQEDDEITALMRVTDIGDRFPRQQIDSSKQRDGAFSNIFVIALDNTLPP